MELLCRAVHDRSYRIYLDWGILENLDDILKRYRLGGPFYIITDRNVYAHHGKKLLQTLKPYPNHHLLVPPGETSKDIKNWIKIHDFLLQKGADRRSVVIAFGGGVIGDLAGFAAATFMRGLPLIHMPTTILSQADSSVGAKVAVNHPLAKNLIGSFYQPLFVLTDPSFLSTLPRREVAAGLGEIIKYGIIADADLFHDLYENIELAVSFNKEYVTNIMRRCISHKIRIVEQDERETGLRKILNFGHTIGHALEAATGYTRFRHGEAVAWGMLGAGWIALQRKLWHPDELDRLKSILIRAKCLYPLGKLTPGKVLTALKHDKKKVGGTLNFILPEQTGRVIVVKNIREEEVMAALRFLFSFQQ